mmetsp:Transcript_17017/g.21754  ORF Transcript_17017/g.21754 Transcript_17017/m.21754 type:complete len:156 (-) Transcript_17017:282-749(-)
MLKLVRRLCTRGLSSVSSKSHPLQVQPQRCMIIFYDGSCPLCKREIQLYDWLQTNLSHKQNIEFYNIATKPAPEILVENGVKKEDALRRIHGIDEGRLVKNAQAFQSLWKHTPIFNHSLYYLTIVPGVLPFLEHLYEYWADRRWRRRGKNCGRND